MSPPQILTVGFLLKGTEACVTILMTFLSACTSLSAGSPRGRLDLDVVSSKKLLRSLSPRPALSLFSLTRLRLTVCLFPSPDLGAKGEGLYLTPV